MPVLIASPASPRAVRATSHAQEAVALDGIAREFDEPAARAHHLASARAAMARAGKKPADLAQFQWQADLVVLRRYIDVRDTKGARAYLAQARSRLAAEAPRIEAAIGIIEAEVEGERLATEIAPRIAGSPTGRIDGERLIAELAAIPSDAARAATLERLRARFRGAKGTPKREGMAR